MPSSARLRNPSRRQARPGRAEAAKSPFLEALPWAAWALISGLLVLLSASHRDLLLNDSFRAFVRAQDLTEQPGVLSLWVHEYYPVGYPLLIAVLAKLTGDAFSAARIISVMSASGMLALVVLMIRQHIAARFLPLVITAVLVAAGGNMHFLQLGTYDNTDIPAAALMLASLYWLGRAGKYRFLGAGLWLGAAYLMRYTALTQVPALLAAIALLGPGTLAQRFRAGAWFLAGFVVVGLVQFIPSLLLTGNPFYNLQAHNVWFALHGKGNWGQSFMEAVKHTSVAEIARESPGLFLRNYLLNLYKLLCYDLFGFPLGWLWIPGLAAAWLAGRNRFATGALALACAVFGAAISLAFVTPRTILYLFPILCVLAGCALSLMAGRKVLGWAVLIGVGLYSASSLYTNKDFLKPAFAAAQQPTQQEKVTAALEKAGMRSPSQVLSLSFAWYHARHPYRAGYEIPWSFYQGGEPIASPEKLARLVEKNGYRFIISDGSSVKDVPGLESFWPRVPTNLRPDTVLIENEVCVIALRY